MTEGSGREPRARAVRAATFAAAALASLYLVELRASLDSLFPPGSLASLTSGQAPIPFQYRMLIPWFVQGLHRVLPLSSWGFTYDDTARWIEAASCLGVYFGLRALLMRGSFGERTASLGALLVFPLLVCQYVLPRSQPYSYVWDLPAALLFTLAVLCLRDRRWWAFYALYAMAAFNRESGVFLSAVYLLTAWRIEPPRRVAVHLAAQFVLWLSIKVTLYRLYAGNPGQGALYYLVNNNLITLATPGALLEAASAFGFAWIPLLVLRRAIEDRFTRRATLVLVPWFCAAFCVGELTELRIWGDLTALVAAGLLELGRSLSRRDAVT